MGSFDQQRVEISDQILKNFLRRISHGKISELANDIGLPYGMVYNLIYGRIKSLSAQDYKLIFGENPPDQSLTRVDGAYFRQMVRLWLYLNDDVTEADLYREFHQDKQLKKVDYRLFSGVTKTIDNSLERVMEQKFLDQSFDRQDIKELIKELVLIENEERVSYHKIKPIVGYLQKKLDVNPTRILNQRSIRYENGELKTVSKKVYDDALELKKRTESALNSGSRFRVERIREEIYGKRKGFTLYSEVESELEFLQMYGKKGVRKFLGRSISYYKKSKLKRIASWRALAIKDACNDLIDNKPEIALRSLPKSQADVRIKKLLSALTSHSIVRAIREDDGTEKRLLAPLYYDKKDFEIEKYGLISMDKTAYFLGMSKMAFDLLVAVHSEIFRRIGTYNKQWYLPYLYVCRLKEKKGFNLIKGKYEVLAKNHETSHRPVKHTEPCIPTPQTNDSLQKTDGKQKVTMENAMSCLPPEVCCNLH
ncbi:MAG: hypothetical protein JSV38_12165 [Desulfobacterales bacterium]|nr:MAG: hypothetical protein JSV38_12165 [Desulfobacterales bacterium]